MVLTGAMETGFRGDGGLIPHYRGEPGVPIWAPDSQVLAFTRETEVFSIRWALHWGRKYVDSFSKFLNNQGNPKTLLPKADFEKVKDCRFESPTPQVSTPVASRGTQP